MERKKTEIYKAAETLLLDQLPNC
uniref:Uncharacterized protein n=1 Tax=Nelumbo nucifera TaxID=4432 RepID=A0A822YN71_NELNU|nr:TPA_asm: hypothetical protein HUJ06_011316 [Nelumbo nucifera]